MRYSLASGVFIVLMLSCANWFNLLSVKPDWNAEIIWQAGNEAAIMPVDMEQINRFYLLKFWILMK